MMGIKKVLILVFGLFSLALCACSNPTNNNDNKDNQKPEERTNTSEDILNSFMNKVKSNKYEIKKGNFLKITSYSSDLVYVDYYNSSNFVYMTVNQDETYMTTYEDNNLDTTNLKYVGEGSVSNLLSDTLLSLWVDYSKENIWDCFTNYQDNKLKFLIIDQGIKNEILDKWSNISKGIVGRIETMDLVLNNEDSTSAQIVTKFNSDGAYIEDNIININFEVERKDNLPSDVWVNNDNRVYPEAMTKWNDDMETSFGAVFDQTLVSKMNEIMPFPDFATRTFMIDNNSFMSNGTISMRDKNATKDQMNNYISKLIQAGYERNYSEKDVLRYDLLIREYDNQYFSYATFYLEYDNGINMVVTKNYNEIKYNGRTTINSFLTNMNFHELDKDNNLTSFEATDLTFAEIEGYSYLSLYNKVLNVTVSYDNYLAVEEYMDNYCSLLEAMGYIRSESSDSNYHSFESELCKNSFSYMVDSSTNNIYIIFRYMSYIEDSMAKDIINNMGFPQISLETFNSTCKDITKFYEIQYNLKHELVLDLTLEFESVAKKEEFLDAYRVLLENDSFEYYDNPILVKVPYKAHAFYNSTKRLIIAFNFDDSNMLSLHMMKVSAGFEPLSE